MTPFAGRFDDAAFVVESEVMVGHRTYPDGPMQTVEPLLDEIVQAAAGI